MDGIATNIYHRSGLKLYFQRKLLQNVLRSVGDCKCVFTAVIEVFTNAIVKYHTPQGAGRTSEVDSHHQPSIICEDD